MKRIRALHITHLLQATHLVFHQYVIGLIREAGAANLHVEAIFPAYAEAVLLQQEHLDKNKQRKIIDAHYRDIVVRINAYALIAPDDTINSFVDKVNDCIY